MCQLLGLSFNVPVRPEISFRGFMRRGKSNPHGWGLALYPDGRAAQVFKEPVEAGASPLAGFLRDYPRLVSPIFIGHVRFASSGGRFYRNTHPFERALGGRDWVFAHNGTLRDFGKEGNGKFMPLGDTDSEWAFCRILDWLDNKAGGPWTSRKYKALAELLGELNELGALNVLMSDGERLFCYHDRGGYNGLCYLRRQYDQTWIKMVDEDWEVDLGRIKKPGQKGYVVATNPLTDEAWENFATGQLIVFKRGGIAYR
jgi:predicted glutamine amidotransferase